MIVKLEETVEEMALTYFKMVTLYSPEGTERNHEKYYGVAGVWSDVEIRHIAG
jgi:hypothetical protein